MTKEQRIGLNLIITFTLILVSNAILRYFGLDYNFRFFTGLDYTHYALAMMSFIYVIVLLISDVDFKSQIIRTSIVFILIGLPIFISLYEVKEVNVIERSGYIVYVLSDDTQNGSIDEIYVKQNFLISKYIDHHLADKDTETTYIINDDQLVIIEDNTIIERYDLE